MVAPECVLSNQRINEQIQEGKHAVGLMIPNPDETVLIVQQRATEFPILSQLKRSVRNLVIIATDEGWTLTLTSKISIDQVDHTLPDREFLTVRFDKFGKAQSAVVSIVKYAEKSKGEETVGLDSIMNIFLESMKIINLIGVVI